ncbi:Ubiquitin-related domain [Trinorchestia longiramus]|nr:Ubiquitin-related domain [Trinorchestia longiramus]
MCDSGAVSLHDTDENIQQESSSHDGKYYASDETPLSLSHSEMKEVFRKTLAKLLSSDPILHDLHPDITHQEVSGMLEVEAGRSMVVEVERADGRLYRLQVPRDARVHQLKAALKTHVTQQLHREGSRRHISWRSVWRRYWLVHPATGTKLVDHDATLASLDIQHKDKLVFLKRDNKTR